MTYELTIPPIAFPVSRDEFKTMIGESDDAAEVNTLIDRVLSSAVERVQHDSQIQLMTATHKLHLDCFPEDLIQLEKPPIQSIASIKYIDTEGVLQTLNPSLYQIDLVSKPGRIYPAPGKSWPSTKAGWVNSVVIEFVAGYIDSNSVPAIAKEAIELLAGYEYDFADEKGGMEKAVTSLYESLISDLRWGL